ncbi:MAG: tetratricopeptide repeat protein [Bacteroidia bacterium]|nr:tetratricopeptide repeat protein [Bacteroidia bacterium]
MRKQILLFLLIFVGFCQVQASVRDSLQQVVSTYPNDTFRVKALLGLAEIVRRQDPRVAIGYAEEAEAISDSLHYEKGTLKSWTSLGNIYLQLKFLSKSLEYFDKAITLQVKNGDKDLANSYNSIGLLHAENGLKEEAIAYFDKSTQLYLESGDTAGAVMPTHNKAVEFAESRDFDMAEKIYLKNLEIINREKLSLGWKAATLNNLGNASRERGDYERSIEYLQQAFEIKKTREDWFGVSNTANNIARAYLKLKNFKEAEFYLDLAREKAQISENNEALNDNLDLRSDLAEAKGDFESALKYYRQFAHNSDSVKMANEGKIWRFFWPCSRTRIYAGKLTICRTSKIWKRLKNRPRKASILP